MLLLCLFLCLFLSSTGYAFLRGGGPERWTAGLFLTAYALSVAVQTSWATRYDIVEAGIFAVDTTLFVTILGITLTANRFWPICMSGLVAMPLAAHIVKLMDPTLIPGAYQVLLAGWSYPAVFLLAVATWRHQRRLRRLGVDPSWSNSLPIADLPIRLRQPKA